MRASKRCASCARSSTTTTSIASTTTASTASGQTASILGMVTQDPLLQALNPEALTEGAAAGTTRL